MKYIFLVVTILFAAEINLAQFKNSEQIINEIRKKYDDIKDYTATIEATVDMERLKVPNMNVKVYFKQPDKFHVESKNFAMIPREGVAINPADLLNKFETKLIGIEEVNLRPAYKIELIPKNVKNIEQIESYIYIDTEHLYISKLISKPSETRNILVNFTQMLVQNKFYLPSKIEIKFENKTPEDDESTKQNRPSRRMPRTGKVSILYKNYQLNTGLSDTLFVKTNSN